MKIAFAKTQNLIYTSIMLTKHCHLVIGNRRRI